MYYFINQTPDLGEISALVWFLMRVTPATMVALGGGGAAIWVLTRLSENSLLIAITTFTIFAIWGVLMYYYISHLPD